ncbi:hypothetical protein CYY_004361 [Polysphondylium violaceum]|uniref:Uncharacterized protein n=1 Tax=Polysphondylium violaceum TaxID=133409 RepID=A0A8J4UZA6_9MYCE|nr:hypothetical protein CYY_004361 [Polysphondylium violaceum]
MNSNNINNLFFSIIRNQYLNKTIISYCKYDNDGDEHHCFNYYDLPIQYICKHNKWDIFDKKWNIVFNDNSGSGNNNNTSPPSYRFCDILDLSKEAMLAFFRYNTCYDRYQRVSTQWLQHVYKPTDSIYIYFFENCVKAPNADIRIIRELYEIAIGIFPFLGYSAPTLNGRIDVFDIVTKHQSTSLVVYLYSNVQYHYYPLVYHIYNRIKERDRVECKETSFDLSKLSSEVIEYMSARKECNLVLSKLPPQYPDAVPFILEFDYEVTKVTYDIIEAVSFGDVRILERMIRDKPDILDGFDMGEIKAIPNVSTLEFIHLEFPKHVKDWPFKWASIEKHCIGDLDLVKYLHSIHFEFTIASLGAPYQVLVYLDDNNLLHMVDPSEDDDIRYPLIQKDIRVLKLLSSKYQSWFESTLLATNFLEWDLELIKFLISIGVFDDISVWSLMEYLPKRSFPYIYNHRVSLDPQFAHEFSAQFRVMLTTRIYKRITPFGGARVDSKYLSSDHIRIIREASGVSCLLFLIDANWQFTDSPTPFILDSPPKYFKSILEKFRACDIIDHQFILFDGYTLFSLFRQSIQYSNFKLMRQLSRMILAEYPSDQLILSSLTQDLVYDGKYQNKAFITACTLVFADQHLFFDHIIKEFKGENALQCHNILKHYIMYHQEHNTLDPKLVHRFNEFKTNNKII